MRNESLREAPGTTDTAEDGGFDPYLKWLGISPEDYSGAPDHYLLLGIKRSVADPDAIANAADRQMGHVRTFQNGKHADESQKLLNAIATAQACLLNEEKKAAYDETLRRNGGNGRAKPPVRIEQEAVTTQANVLAVTAEQPQKTQGSVLDRRRSKTRKQTNWLLVSGVAAGGAAVLGGAAWLATGSGDKNEKTKENESVKEITYTEEELEKEGLTAGLPHAQKKTPVAIEPQEDEPVPVKPDPVEPAPKAPAPFVPFTPPKSKKPVQLAQVSTTKEPQKVAVVKKERYTGPAVQTKKPRVSPEELKAAKEEVKDAFAEEYTKAKSPKARQRLADKLLGMAQKETRLPHKIALLEKARELAIRAGNLSAAWGMIETMAKEDPNLDVLAEKNNDLQSAIAQEGIQSYSTYKRYTENGITLFDEAVREERLDILKKILKNIRGGYVKFEKKRGRGDKDLLAEGKDRFAQEKTLAVVSKAQDVLEKDPTNKDANLVVGKYKCSTGNVSDGLLMLLLSGDKSLRDLAEKDLEVQKTKDMNNQIAVGKDWLSLWKTSKEDWMRERGIQMIAAGHVSAPELTKFKILKLLKEFGVSKSDLENGGKPEIVKNGSKEPEVKPPKDLLSDIAFVNPKDIKDATERSFVKQGFKKVELSQYTNKLPKGWEYVNGMIILKGGGKLDIGGIELGNKDIDVLINTNGECALHLPVHKSGGKQGVWIIYRGWSKGGHHVILPIKDYSDLPRPQGNSYIPDNKFGYMLGSKRHSVKRNKRQLVPVVDVSLQVGDARNIGGRENITIPADDIEYRSGNYPSSNQISIWHNSDKKEGALRSIFVRLNEK